MDMGDFMTIRADALLYPLAGESDTSADDESVESEQISLLESLRDPEVSRGVGNREYEGWSPASMFAPSGLSVEQSFSLGNHPGNATPPYPPIDLIDTGRRQAADARRSPPLVDDDEAISLDSGARVTVDYSDSIEWPEDPSMQNVIADRRRRTRLMQREQDPLLTNQMRERLQRHRDRAYSQRMEDRRRRLGLPPRYGENPAPDRRCELARSMPYLRARHEATRKNMAKDLSYFRFNMQEGKNTASMKFDPPM